MFLPNRIADTNTRAMVDQWRGYNHNYKISAGEFYDMENLRSDYFPLMVPRKKRIKLVKEDHIFGILLTENQLCYLTETEFHYGSKVYDLSSYATFTEEQQLIRFGAYILIFPTGIYINVINDEIGTMAEKYVVPAGKTISYTMCDIDGNAFSRITASNTAPTNPSDGDYWLNTTDGEQGLNMWVASTSMWQPVATTYIKVEIPDGTLLDYFEEGDTVTFNSSLSDINNGSTIQKITNTYMVIIGLIPSGVTYSEVTDNIWKLTIERKLPELDYVCTSNNRVWGCHYGSDGKGGIVNEIYASKLGDFRNWYTYEGLSTDSYAVSVGEDGYWTGCISYQGKPVFFKENSIFRIYGSYPAEYQLVINNARGVQRGSSKSLAVVNEYLIYKSAADIVVYDGTNPTSISQALGRDKIYYDAVAGGTMNKYYISMQDTRGSYYYFVYDMEYNLWMREDADLHVRQFTTSESGQIYACTDTEIYGIGANENILFLNPLVGEEYVEWWAETGEIGYEYPDYKQVKRIAVRAYVPFRSEVQLWISYDDRPFEEKGVIRGNDEIRTQVISIQPMRCDHYRLRFTGHGDCRIYTMTTTLDTDGGEYD